LSQQCDRLGFLFSDSNSLRDLPKFCAKIEYVVTAIAAFLWENRMNLGLGQTLGGRYNIITQLGQGGFGKTFVAQDLHLPGNQKCVVKQLKPQSTDPLTLQTARRLFDTEAKVLHHLGNHDQIPQLFAYFEENQEFYLVQELIEGDDLSEELTPPTPPYQGGARGGSSSQGGTKGGRLSEVQVIALLKDILEVLEFVHQKNVIHRDINPRNLIRRKKDGKLVLIDFGAVKQVSTQVIKGGKTSYTIAIGTPGYRPSEQANGYPRLSSDIYAVGMVGIQALTGILPEQLPTNPDTCEISWQDQVSVSPELAKILDKMVRYDFRERYSSATSALQALTDLTEAPNTTRALPPASSPKPFFTKPKLSKALLYKVLISIAVIGLGVAVTVSVLKVIKSANATDLYQRGETLLELKRYKEALNAYNRAVELKPEYAEAWKGQGNSLLELKRYQEALDAYDKAIQIQPNYLEAWNGRGKALDYLQRYKEAIASFDAALKIEPNNLEALNERGNMQIKLQQYSDAIASFDKVVKIQPDYSPAWYRRGWALHNLRRYQEAVQSYDKAVEYKPDSSETWYQRGNALINLQKYKEAVESYDKAVQFQPNFYTAWYSRGSALSNLRQYPEAVASFDQAVKFKPDDYDAWYSRGWALHQLQRYEEAVTAYDKAVKLQPNSYQAWYNLGNALYNLKQYQEAIASYNRAVENKPDHYEAWYSRGNALLNLKRYPEAIESYDKAIRFKPDYREAIDARNKAQSQIESEQKKREAQKDSTQQNPQKNQP
jgi:tetratricopeptide (TPR) repeat protein/tRNA A-37 threonylcarbamoyl transferase component Bud32